MDIKIKNVKPMNLEKERVYIDKYLDINRDLLSDSLVKSMAQYRHHGEINTLYHSVYVSYCVLKMCCTLNAANTADIVRASLLHDFYLYEWYTEKHDENHIFYHPKESVKNIEEYFGRITSKQKNMILAHMCPLSKKMPGSLGAWMLTAADKYCATQDYFAISARFSAVYDEILRKSDYYAG